MFMCPLSPAGATVQPWPLRRPGGLAPERAGEGVTTVDAAGRSGAAPETVAPKYAAPETASSKHAAPEQGTSDCPMKRARVRSKM
jgi:hypothetical protein